MLVMLALLLSPIPAETRQMVLSISPNWTTPTARVRLYERTPGSAWKPVGEAVAASLGKTGLAWGRGLHPEDVVGTHKKEGDGKSPAGIFELRLATGYSKGAPPGTHLTWREATPTLRCVDDPKSRYYNRLVDEAAVVKDWSSAEDMRRTDDLYRLVVWVGHNDSPPVPDEGSCIFLHLRADASATTAGCTAFDSKVMERLLQFLDPAARPVLVQLPLGTYRTLAPEWGLPAQ
jgi:L,D-peptidoglycan transpeptidase YkuD (ErfK/YbiS/YcfS/YnhG family)